MKQIKFRNLFIEETGAKPVSSLPFLHSKLIIILVHMKDAKLIHRLIQSPY